jgi:phosphoribosylformylglycinamidine synthase
MRQEGMKDWEILLSESQERMLVIVKKGMEAQVEKVLEKWDLTYNIIGEVTDSGRVQYYMNDELRADIPGESLVLGGGAPVYHREYTEPKYFKEIAQFDMNDIPDLSFTENNSSEKSVQSVAKFLAAHPNIASKRWVYNQYDSMVGTINQTTNAPSDASVVKVKGTDKSIAMTVDCNSRFVWADPFVGGQIAVAEAARNLVCAGAEPAAITNCLNFGNPYNPEVYYQFVYAIKGMGEACKKFDTPVTGGNVSFYNQSSDNDAVFPTPTIGMVGLIGDNKKHMTMDFKNAGDVIYMLGKSKNDIGSSHYLAHYHKIQYSPAPYFNLDEEHQLHKALLGLINGNHIESAHDVSEGGLFITLLESAMNRNLSFDVSTPLNKQNLRTDAFLFGEAQGRAVISVKSNNCIQVESYLSGLNMPFEKLGTVTENTIQVNEVNFGQTTDFANIYNNSLAEKLA